MKKSGNTLGRKTAREPCTCGTHCIILLVSWQHVFRGFSALSNYSHSKCDAPKISRCRITNEIHPNSQTSNSGSKGSTSPHRQLHSTVQPSFRNLKEPRFLSRTLLMCNTFVIQNQVLESININEPGIWFMIYLLDALCLHQTAAINRSQANKQDCQLDSSDYFIHREAIHVAIQAGRKTYTTVWYGQSKFIWNEKTSLAYWHSGTVR